MMDVIVKRNNHHAAAFAPPLFVIVFLNLCRLPVMPLGCECNTSTAWHSLRALYDSTKGNNWSRRTNWLQPNTTVCQWHGVTCTEISLSSNSLNGTLPSEMQYFTGITRFNVASNSLLRGTLPPEYSAWGSSIRYFDVRGSPLETTLPASYGNWSNLEAFYVCMNAQLTGTLPESYGSWSRLSDIHLHDTGLSGTLPASYASWTAMSYFDADDAFLTGAIPRYVMNWTQLSYFDVSFNNFTEIAEGMEAKRSLFLDLSDNSHLVGIISVTPQSSGFTLSACGTRDVTLMNGTVVLGDRTAGALMVNCSGWHPRIRSVPIPPAPSTPVTSIPTSAPTATTSRNNTAPAQGNRSQAPSVEYVNIEKLSADVGTVAVGVSSAVGMTMQLTNLAGGGMGALGSLQVSMGASRIAARVKKCSQASPQTKVVKSVEIIADDDTEIGGLVADSPLRLSLAAYRFPLTLGTVVGNVAVFALAPMAMAIAAVAYWFVEYVWLRHTLSRAPCSRTSCRRSGSGC